MKKALFIYTIGSSYYTFLQYVSNGITIEHAIPVPHFEHICCYIGESEDSDNANYTIIANGDKICISNESDTDYKIIGKA